MADDPQQPVGVPPDIPGAGRQRLLPQPLPTRHPQTLSEQRSAAREELGVQERESEQQFAAREEPGVQELESEQCARDPVGNVITEVAAVENIGNQVTNDDNHDVVNSPVIGSVPDIADINHGLLDGAAVETITGV